MYVYYWQVNKDIWQILTFTERKEEIANLAERLLAADRRELDLKEKLHNLQKAEKEMELALQEQKRANEDLKQELKDQDELIGKSKHTGWLTQSFSTFPSPVVKEKKM